MRPALHLVQVAILGLSLGMAACGGDPRAPQADSTLQPEAAGAGLQVPAPVIQEREGAATAGGPPAAMLRPLALPAARGALAPSLAAGPGGVLLSWLEPVAGGREQALRFSILHTVVGTPRWSPAGTVVQGADFFANWADVPSLQEAADGRLYAHWLRRAGDGAYSYHVEMARTGEAGATWRRLGRVHRDDSASEHGFVSLLPEARGVRAFWLDGGGMAGGHDGSMSLRTALVEEAPAGETVLDPRVCECCRTAAVLAAAGPVVVYRDRSPEEVRDVWIVRRTATGWSAPAPVHLDGWVVPGCPVNGPAVAAQPGQPDHLAVAWYTAAGNEPRVLVAFSRDGGASFAPPVRVDDGRPLGRVDLLLDAGGEALVAWLEAGEGEAASLRLRRLAPGSHVPGPAQLLAATTGSRSSGFPRLAWAGQELVAVWTQGDDPTRLASGSLDPAQVPAGGTVWDGPVPAWDGRPGTRAPAYAARDLEGRLVDLGAFLGRPLLLNVWATWCAPCRGEIPALIGIHRRFGGRGLQVVGVSVDGAASRELVHRFLEEEGIPYRTLLDPRDRASAVFGLSFLPGSFLFDAEGVLVWRRDGVVQEDDPELLRAVEQTLGAGA